MLLVTNESDTHLLPNTCLTLEVIGTGIDNILRKMVGGH